MGYLKFLMRHPYPLSFGVLLTLFSSFGQTFLISIFVPQILNSFSLNSGQFGTLYAAITLTSALCLPFFGKLLDKVDLRSYTLAVGLALACACWLLAISPNVPVLALALLGLRLSGQGLLGLTASTAMARLFTDFRGRALSISGAGYPLGEGLLPVLVVVLISHFGWRISWGIAGFFVALIFLPIIALLLQRIVQYPCNRGTENQRSWSRKELLTDWRFYLFLPGVLTVPFLLTGLFLYQLKLAEFKGWTPALMALGFVGYAAFRMLASFLVGPIIDRFGPARIFPFSILPLAMGVGVLWTQTESWAVHIFFITAGLSQGVAGVIMTALWAQRYGADVLGRVKSIVSMLVICSTALSPALFGWLLTTGASFNHILPCALVLCIGSICSGLLAQRLCFGAHTAPYSDSIAWNLHDMRNEVPDPSLPV